MVNYLIEIYTSRVSGNYRKGYHEKSIIPFQMNSLQENNGIVENKQLSLNKPSKIV